MGFESITHSITGTSNSTGATHPCNENGSSSTTVLVLPFAGILIIAFVYYLLSKQEDPTSASVRATIDLEVGHEPQDFLPDRNGRVSQLGAPPGSQSRLSSKSERSGSRSRSRLSAHSKSRSRVSNL